jgi:hypothetical protein
VTRPRAADDFAMIRARMEELRHERAQVLAEVIHPRPYHRAASTIPSMKAGSTPPRVISGPELRGLDIFCPARKALTRTLSARSSG